MSSFNNKVVLVTGASSGIGAAIAQKFAEEGANVALVGRNEEKLRNVSENITKIGKRPLVIVADLSQDKDVKKVVADTVEQFGKIDVLVNNAGAGAFPDFTEERAMEVFDQLIATNLRSVVYLSHLASKYIVGSKGNIINISSVEGQSVERNFWAYATSKAALDHFSRSIALDLASKGVRVNTISPGPVKTDILQNMGFTNDQEEAFFQKLLQSTALKRLSEPVEIAELALFLASDKAVGITGSTFVTDNGRLLERNTN